MVAEIGTALVSGPGGIKGATMGKDFKSDHFKFMENVDQDVEDLIVKGFTQSCPKSGESVFTRDLFCRDAGIGAIGPAAILVPQDGEEMAHIMMTVDMTKKVEEE